MLSVLISVHACPSPRACRTTGMRSSLAHELPACREQLLPSGNHALGEVLVEEVAFRVHRARCPNDRITVLERPELDDDGPFSLCRCRGSSAVGPFDLEFAGSAGSFSSRWTTCRSAASVSCHVSPGFSLTPSTLRLFRRD